MNLEIWAKTIFSVYRYLPKLASSIDKIVELKAVSANNISGVYFSSNDTLNITNSLIELTERKVALINLKVLAEKILKSIDKKEAKILILRFMDNFTMEKIGEMLDTSARTIYRKVNEGLKSSSAVLSVMGYNIKKLEEMTSGEKWIRQLCEEYERKNDIIITASKLKDICYSYKKIGMELQSSIS